MALRGQTAINLIAITTYMDPTTFARNISQMAKSSKMMSTKKKNMNISCWDRGWWQIKGKIAIAYRTHIKYNHIHKAQTFSCDSSYFVVRFMYVRSYGADDGDDKISYKFYFEVFHVSLCLCLQLILLEKIL